MRRSWLGLIGSSFLVAGACGSPPPTLDGSVDGSRPTGPPPPYTPPAEGAPECEFAADCPDGTYCDLGECIQSCNTVDPCAPGATSTCLSRGRCAASPTEPSDPPIVEDHTATVTSDDDVITLSAMDTVAIIRLSATPIATNVRYRIAPQVSWLHATTPRGEFAGSTMLTLQIDRTGLAAGTHAGTVVIRTTAGDVSVAVQLTQDNTGVYQGELHYTTPRDLGSVPLRVEVQDRGTGLLDLRVLADASPTFPRAGTAQATASATSTTGGALTGAFTQTFHPADLGGSDPVVNRDIGREFRFSIEGTASGGLEGTFTERWIGLFPLAVEVSGTIAIARITDVMPQDFTVDLPGSLPGNPSANPPAISAACYAASAPFGAESGAACTASSTSSQLRVCGERMSTRSSSFETASIITTVTGGDSGYDALSNLCASDVAASTLTTPQQATVSCFHPGNWACAAALLETAAVRGDTDAFGSAGTNASHRAGVAMLLVNDILVDAFELPFRVDTPGVETMVLDRLRAARDAARPALQDLFMPDVLETLRTTPAAVASTTSYVGLRRIAQLVARDHLAADQISSIEIRTRPASRDATRMEIHSRAVELLITLIALSTIEHEQAAPPSAELGLFAETLTELGRRSLEAGEQVDPLGVPSTFIPFIFDPTRTSTGSTNFEQVLSAYSTAVNVAVTDQMSARTAVHDFEETEATLRNELNMVGDQIRTQLIALCGPLATDPTQPDVDHCGEGGIGAIAESRSVLDEAAAGVQTAQARHDALITRIDIERARVAQIRGLRADDIAFIDSTNMQINAHEWEGIGLHAAQTALALASSSSLWSGFAGIALGAASAAIELLEGYVHVAQMQLRQAQDLRVRETDATVEYINGMANIREMMTGIAELELEITQSILRAATAGIHVRTQQSDVTRLQAELDLQQARALSGLANDPAFRVLRNQAVERALGSRDDALVGIYLAARAFEFETNTDLPAIETALVPSLRASDVQSFAQCLMTSEARFRTAYGAPQTFVDEISLREDVLGIHGPVVDEITGETLSEADQFHRLLLAPSNLGPDGTVALVFSTSLNRGNGLFSTMVCNDQIRSLQVRLIGDGLGDDQARIYLVQTGTSVLRGCDSGLDGASEVLRSYDLPRRQVEIQAGVNVMPTSPADTQFFGRSVADSEWRLAIPPGSVAPANSDIDPIHIDDIIIRVEHQAISISTSPVTYMPACGT